MTMTITGISSMATRQVLAELSSMWTQRTGVSVEIESVGGVAAARRVEDGEAFDIVVLASNALDKLAAAGRIDDAGRVSVARSGVSVAVKAGAPHPSIASEADVREAVLAARSIGYSTGPSGVYVLQLLERWGIGADDPRVVQAKPGIPVGSLIASGEVEIGFQQTSELIGVDGIDVLGALPPGIQTLTVFQAAVCTNAREPQRARELLAFMVSPDADAVKIAQGMEPVRA